MPHSTETTADIAEKLDGPATTARTLLIAAVLSITYLDFFAYKNAGFSDPASLDDRLLGNASAPDQYRMGIYLAAHWLTAHLHIVPAKAFALLDGTAALIAVLLLFAVLEHSETYARATRLLQWFGASAFVLLVLWFMGWFFWLHKPEALPAAALVAAMLTLWQRRRAPWLTASAVLLLTIALASFRADIACLLNLGVLLYALSTRQPQLALPRSTTILITTIAALAAAGIQLWLTRIVYPQASYGLVKMWQLRPNLIHATRWPPFLLFLLPLLWMLVRAARNGLPHDPAGRALLTAALLYTSLWITIGKIDEVRIFIPFALALTPLIVQTMMARLTPAPAAHSAPQS